MITNIKDLIKLRNLQDKRIDDLWCEAQQDDMQRLIDLMEEVSLASFQASHSPMGHDLLKQAKKNFVDELLTTAEDYRYVIPVVK